MRLLKDWRKWSRSEADAQHIRAAAVFCQTQRATMSAERLVLIIILGSGKADGRT